MTTSDRQTQVPVAVHPHRTTVRYLHADLTICEHLGALAGCRRSGFLRVSCTCPDGQPRDVTSSFAYVAWQNAHASTLIPAQLLAAQGWAAQEDVESVCPEMWAALKVRLMQLFAQEADRTDRHDAEESQASEASLAYAAGALAGFCEAVALGKGLPVVREEMLKWALRGQEVPPGSLLESLLEQ